MAQSDCMLDALVKVSDEVLAAPRRSGQCTSVSRAPTTGRLYRVWWPGAIESVLSNTQRSL
jgi:hypothetical protein